MAYSFNGSNRSLLSTGAAAMSEPLTLAAWFWPNTNTTRTVIFSVGEASDFFGLVEDGARAGDPICATKYTGGTDTGEAVSSAGYTPGQWNHGCAVFESNTSRSVYINGAGKVTSTTNRPAGNRITRIAVAALARNTLSAFFNGRVAEAAIWTAALDDAEVASLAKGMSPSLIRPQSLMYYAPLIRDINDIRGGIAITNNNGATVADHPRVYR